MENSSSFPISVLHLTCNLPLETCNYTRRIIPVLSPKQMAQMARGGIDRASRCTQRYEPIQPHRKCVNSVALAEPPASHFGGNMTQMVIFVSFVSFHHKQKRRSSERRFDVNLFPPSFTGEGKGGG